METTMEIPVSSMPNLSFSLDDIGNVVLFVQRGISCERHIEVFTHHTTNQPSWEALDKTVQGMDKIISRAHSSFVDFSKSIPKMEGCGGGYQMTNWDVINSIGNLFFKELVRVVTLKAEKLSYDLEKKYHTKDCNQ